MLVPFALALPLLQGPLTPDAALPALPDDLARLVPEGAVALAVSASIDDLERALESILTEVGEEVPEVGLAASLLTPIGYFDLEVLDRSRPFGVAMALPEGGMMGPPTTVLLLPARDAQALAESAKLPSMYAPEIVQGDYVGFPYGATYAVGESAHPLAEGLVPGLLDLRVDLKTLLATYGPMIQMGLASARQMYANMEVPDAPMDVGQVMGLYIDAAQALMSSVDRLDAHGSYVDARVGLWGDLGLVEGSALAGYHAALEVDYAPLMRYVDGGAMMNFAGAMGDAAYAERVRPIFDALVELYPEGLREGMQDYMAEYMAQVETMGRMAVGNADFGPNGMEIAYHLAAPDPEQAVANLVELLGRFRETLLGMGMGLGELRTRELDGATLHAFDWNIDAEAFATAMGSGAAMEPEALKQMIEAIYGKDLTWVVGALEDRLTMYVGSATGAVDEAFSAPPRDAGAPALFEEAVARLGGACPAMAFRMDLGASLEMGARFQGIAGMPAAPFPGDLPPFSLAFFGGFLENALRGGLALDVRELGAFVRAMEEEEPK